MRTDKRGKIQIDWPLAFLLLLNLFLFLPSLFEPISYGDECIYLTLGQAFRKGLVFYRDIHDNKPPLIYLLAALSFNNLSVFRTFNIIFNSVHLGILYHLIKKLTKGKSAPLIGGLVFIICYLLFEGRIANGEMFMMMPVTLAVYLIFAKERKKGLYREWWIGFLFALGFLFKIPVFFDFIGILAARYLIPITKMSWLEIKKLLKNKALLANFFGFTLPILLTIIYYAAKGAYFPYVRSALLQNIGYLSSWQGSSSDLVVRFLLLIIATLIILILRKSLSSKLSFFSLWFAFALFGALLSGRPYPHYLIEIVPSLAILVALAFGERKIINTLPAIVAVGILIISMKQLKFWHYPVIPYYQNFLSFITGKISQQDYLKYWGERTVTNYKLAQFVIEHNHRGERIFLWGDGACIYALANRLPVGKYAVNYHIFDFNGFGETLEAIERTKPGLIIKLKDETREWSELDRLLIRNYHQFLYPGITDQIFLRNQDSR